MRFSFSVDLSLPVAPPRFSRTVSRVGWALGFWVLVQTRTARAENAVSYKYEDYREEDGRISVQSHYGQIEQDLGPDLHVRVQGVIDAIAGATLTGQPPATPGGPVPLTNLTDRRKAWSIDFARQFPRFNLALGFANSRESDYVSNGWSVNATKPMPCSTKRAGNSRVHSQDSMNSGEPT